MTESASDVPQHWLHELERIARQAGRAILDIYEAQNEIKVERKADESPITAADRAANQIILEGLAALAPEVPILSEESEAPSFAQRSRWTRYWLVDPLDGTKEFIGRNGEFTVNIALIDRGVPLLGLVFAPVPDVLYLGQLEKGAWRVQGQERVQIRCRPLSVTDPLRVVASRRHGAEALEPLLQRAHLLFSDVETLNMGSSLKICKLAEGEADWYPRLALTAEWDTAAAQAVLEAAGGVIVDESLQVLRYNRKESLLNPHFHALADPAFEWRQLLLPQH